MIDPVQFPIQGGGKWGMGEGTVRREVYMRAYEVYKHCHGEQKAMIEGTCRGGFDKGEIVAFLYAHSFPKEEWRDRVDEALHGISL